MKKLVVKHEVVIYAAIGKVWEVLIAPKFIRQWDSLPEDFPDYYLETGCEIVWSGSLKLTVAEMIPNERLKLSMYAYKWDLPPNAYDVGYTYEIMADMDKAILKVEIGDFGILENGQEYYDASVEFAHKAMKKIKDIAENRG